VSLHHDHSLPRTACHYPSAQTLTALKPNHLWPPGRFVQTASQTSPQGISRVRASGKDAVPLCETCCEGRQYRASRWTASGTVSMEGKGLWCWLSKLFTVSLCLLNESRSSISGLRECNRGGVPCGSGGTWDTPGEDGHSWSRRTRHTSSAERKVGRESMGD
jgi:hypothetical protein